MPFRIVRSTRVLSCLFALSFAGSAFAQTPAASATPVPSLDASRAPEMDRIAALAGTWTMTPSYYSPAQNAWRDGPVFHAAFVPRYDGRYLHSEYILPMPGLPPFRMDWTLSYDRYRRLYRMAILEDVVGLMDIYEGEWRGDALMLDDKRTGTSAPGASGELMYARFVFRFENAHRIRIVMQGWRNDAWVDGIRIVMDKQPL